MCSLERVKMYPHRLRSCSSRSSVCWSWHNITPTDLSWIAHHSHLNQAMDQQKSQGPSQSIKVNLGQRPVAKPCAFFAQGTCRHGSECRFSHAAPAAEVASTYNAPPPPIIINIPPGQPIFSIDVECVATGVQHNARSVAQVALVDEWSRPVFNTYIKQDMPVVSHIYELTGLTSELLDQYGLPLAEAMAYLRSHLSPNAILVGQSILKDVQWLQLAEGVDYHSLIDLSALFRVWNPARGEYTNFSQDHCAKVWIGVGDRTQHNAITDAAISMSLFNAYRTVQWDSERLLQMQMATLAAPRVPGFSAIYPVVDGCCMGNRKQCTCGAPFY